MTRTITRVATLFMIAMLALSVVGMAFTGGVAAETTTLTGDGSDEVTGFEANESDHLEHDLEAADTDFDTDGSTVALLNITNDGETVYETEDSIDDGTASSHTFNVSHAELDDLPGNAGDSTTVTVTAWGEDTAGNETTAETEFDVDITFDSSYAAVSIDDDSADNETVEPGFFSMSTFNVFSDDDDETELYTIDETVGIDGANTSVTVTDNSDGVDAFDDAIGDKSDGDLIYGATVATDDTPVLAFYGEADDDIVDVDEDTYAVYDGDGVWTIHAGDDYDGETEMDVFLESQSYTNGDFESADLGSLFLEQADMGMMDSFSAFGTWDTFSSFSVMDLLPF